MKKTKKPLPTPPATPRCSACGSSQVYHRVKTNTRRCRLCGAEEAVKVNRVPVAVSNIHN